VAETDESIVRASTRSPEGSGRYPRFTPGGKAIDCTYLNFPPATPKPIVQASAYRCMHVHCTLRMYPRGNRSRGFCARYAKSGSLRQRTTDL